MKTAMTCRSTKQTLFLICFMLACMAGCKHKEDKQQTNELQKYCIDSTLKPNIEIITPEMRPLVEGIPLTGIVEANPDNVVHFVSFVNGIVSNTYFSLGDKVKKGQILAEINSSQLLEFQTQEKTLDAQIQVAEKKLQYVRSLYEDGVASQKDMIEAQSELTILKAEREKIRSILSFFSAGSGKGIFYIKSPATGIVTDKSITAGQPIVADSDPLFTISDLSEVWIMINVHISNIKNIQPGMEVVIKTTVYPGEEFRGKIAAVAQVLDEAKVMKARVVLPNKDLKLKPGMLVDVVAFKKHDQQALSIPTKSLIFDNNRHYVVVYKNDCKLTIKEVELIATNNGTAFIAGGITPDDKIIGKNQLLIYEQIKHFND